MSERMRQESPLVGRKLESPAANASDAAGVIFCERAFLGHINLRGDPASPVFLGAVKRALGCALPLEANSFVDADDVRACWLGPNEWLVMCDGAKERARADELRRVLQGQFAAVTEIGSGQTVIGVSGARARDVIAKGCPLDLHPRVFGPCRCAQTYLGRAGTMILQSSSMPSFELVVRRSYADYLWGWLTDAASEYRYAVVEAAPWMMEAAYESAMRLESPTCTSLPPMPASAA